LVQAVNMLMVRNNRKQYRSCIKFTFSGFLGGKVKDFVT
jgi:hypothetical protein